MSSDFKDFEPRDRAGRPPVLRHPGRRPRETTFMDVAFGLGFIVGIVILIVVAANLNIHALPEAELLVSWVGRTAGLVMAGLALLCLLGRTWQGATINDVAALSLPLLGGVILMQASWSTGLALALIISASLICKHFGGRSGAADDPQEG